MVYIPLKVVYIPLRGYLVACRYPSKIPNTGKSKTLRRSSFDRSFWRAAAGRFGARWLWRSRAAVRRGDQVPRHVRQVNLSHRPALPTPQSPAPCLCVDSLSIPSPFPRTPIRVPRGHLSPGCRAVELSRLRRGAVEPVVEALPVEPVEPVEADSMRRCVEVCRGLSRSVE